MMAYKLHDVRLSTPPYMLHSDKLTRNDNHMTFVALTREPQTSRSLESYDYNLS